MFVDNLWNEVQIGGLTRGGSNCRTQDVKIIGKLINTFEELSMLDGKYANLKLKAGMNDLKSELEIKINKLISKLSSYQEQTNATRIQSTEVKISVFYHRDITGIKKTIHQLWPKMKGVALKPWNKENMNFLGCHNARVQSFLYNYLAEL